MSNSQNLTLGANPGIRACRSPPAVFRAHQSRSGCGCPVGDLHGMRYLHHRRKLHHVSVTVLSLHPGGANLRRHGTRPGAKATAVAFRGDAATRIESYGGSAGCQQRGDQLEATLSLSSGGVWPLLRVFHGTNGRMKLVCEARAFPVKEREPEDESWLD